MKKIIAFVLIVLVVFTVSTQLSYGFDEIISFEAGYAASSTQIFEMAQKLVDKYPYLLELEILGETQLGNPIYAIRLSYRVFEKSEFDYVDKTHLLVEAGTHGRETYNPVAILKMIEDYVHDYYVDDTLSDVDVRDLLKTSVIHFIPLVNPDGFDVSKFGTSSISDLNLRSLFISRFEGELFHRIKSNLSGVDLNRNYDDRYFNIESQTWIDQWELRAENEEQEPSLAGYGGESPFSEMESQLVAQYMDRYDFRAFLAFHSMGQVIYYKITALGSTYLNENTQYANLVAMITDYRLSEPSSSNDGEVLVGYATSYFANQKMKPALTIETTSDLNFPTSLSTYRSEYEGHNLAYVPLRVMEATKQSGYLPYKIYIDGKYFTDAINFDYAKAIAESMSGEVYRYDGKPSLYLSERCEVQIADLTLTGAIVGTSGALYVPFKTLLTEIGYEVIYIKESSSVIAKNQSENFQVNLSDYKVTDKNDDTIKLEASPFIYEGKLMVPLAFAAQLLGVDENAYEFTITGQPVFLDL